MSGFIGVLSSEYPGVRDAVRPHLEALARASLRRWTADVLDRKLLDREMQLWATPDFRTIAITSVEGDTVTVRGCSGDARDWRHLTEPFIAHVEDWAAKLGKKYVSIDGRPGWAWLIRKQGYRRVHIEMLKEVGNG